MRRTLRNAKSERTDAELAKHAGSSSSFVRSDAAALEGTYGAAEIAWLTIPALASRPRRILIAQLPFCPLSVMSQTQVTIVEANNGGAANLCATFEAYTTCGPDSAMESDAPPSDPAYSCVSRMRLRHAPIATAAVGTSGSRDAAETAASA